MSVIRYLNRDEINEHHWNAAVSASLQSLPYAYSWYLDAVAEHWDALVSGDYETVMPLVWLRKLGIRCLYQPYYCQQLGIFSRKTLKPGEAADFIGMAVKKFPYANINLNPSVMPAATLSGFLHKKNLLLNLDRDYTVMKKSFSENQRRNIAKAEKAGLHLAGAISLKDFQNFYLANLNLEKGTFKTKHEKIFITVSDVLIKKKAGEIFAVVNAPGELVAVVLLIHHRNRIINIINTSSAAGKRMGASHYLFDRIIHQYSGAGKILDFEGSSVPGVARFYEGFGAYEETFYSFRHNMLKNPGRKF